MESKHAERGGASGQIRSGQIALEICRQAAVEVWRAERRIEALRVEGMNSELVVRERLRSIALELEADATDLLKLYLGGIDWDYDEPRLIVQKSEDMVGLVCGGVYRSVGGLLDSVGKDRWAIASMLIIQGVAARLGVWAGRGDEANAARVAQRLRANLGPLEWSEYRAHCGQAQRDLSEGRYEDAVRGFMRADGLVRTPANLQKLSLCLERIEDYAGALWAIRAALLEPPLSFETPEAVEVAKDRARHLVEERVGPSLTDPDDWYQPRIAAERVAPEPLPEVGRPRPWGFIENGDIGGFQDPESRRFSDRPLIERLHVLELPFEAAVDPVKPRLQREDSLPMVDDFEEVEPSVTRSERPPAGRPVIDRSRVRDHWSFPRSPRELLDFTPEYTTHLVVKVAKVEFHEEEPSLLAPGVEGAPSALLKAKITTPKND